MATARQLIRNSVEDSEEEINIDEEPEDMNLQSDSEEGIIFDASEGEDEIQASDNEDGIPYPAPNLIGRDGSIWYKVPFVQSRTGSHNIIKGAVDKNFIQVFFLFLFD